MFFLALAIAGIALPSLLSLVYFVAFSFAVFMWALRWRRSTSFAARALANTAHESHQALQLQLQSQPQWKASVYFRGLQRFCLVFTALHTLIVFVTRYAFQFADLSQSKTLQLLGFASSVRDNNQLEPDENWQTILSQIAVLVVFALCSSSIARREALAKAAAQQPRPSASVIKPTESKAAAAVGATPAVVVNPNASSLADGMDSFGLSPRTSTMQRTRTVSTSIARPRTTSMQVQPASPAAPAAPKSNECYLRMRLALEKASRAGGFFLLPGVWFLLALLYFSIPGCVCLVLSFVCALVSTNTAIGLLPLLVMFAEVCRLRSEQLRRLTCCVLFTALGDLHLYLQSAELLALESL